MKRRKQLDCPLAIKSRMPIQRIPLVEHFFRTWFASARRRFRIPLMIVGRSASTLDMRFVGITPRLQIYLHDGELGVAVMHHQECWDLIKVIDTSPQRRGRSHFCRLCRPEARTFYPTLGRLWRKHTFEPFLVWVNETLFSANWLCLLDTPELTAASLLCDEAEVSQRVHSSPDAMFHKNLPDGTIQMSPQDGTVIELLPLSAL